MQMARFETETPALPENRETQADLNGQGIDRFHDRKGVKYIVLDMDGSVIPLMAIGKRLHGTAILTTSAINRTSCSTGLACWKAAPCAMAKSTVLKAGEIFSAQSSPAEPAATSCVDLQPRHLPELHQAARGNG